eukprot:gene30202-35185_t
MQIAKTTVTSRVATRRVCTPATAARPLALATTCRASKLDMSTPDEEWRKVLSPGSVPNFEEERVLKPGGTGGV